MALRQILVLTSFIICLQQVGGIWTCPRQNDCSPEPRLPCSVVSNSSLCELHAERWPTGPGGFWPTAATQFNANFFEKYSSRYKKSYHGANFTWTLPDDGSVKDLTGFQLTLLVLSGSRAGKQICRLFNLSNAHFTVDDINKVSFYHDCLYPIHDNADIYVRLWSLPKARPPITSKFADMFIHTPKWPKDQYTPSNEWLIPMIIKNDTDSRSLEVTFTLAPANYSFEEYLVTLVVNGTGGTVTQQKCLIEGGTRELCRWIVRKPRNSVKFENVCPGVYNIWIQPSTGVDHCRCKDKDGKCMDHCIISAYAVPITIHGEPGDCNPTPSPSPVVSSSSSTVAATPAGGLTPAQTKISPVDRAGVIVGAVLGSVIGILLVLLVAIILFRKYKSPAAPPQDPPKPDPEQAVCNQLVGKKVLILYSRDNSYHTKVVQKLAEYLQHLACHVYFDMWSIPEIQQENKMQWLMNKIDFCDYILIVNSEGAYRKYKARNKGQFYPKMDNDSPLGDMFTPGIVRVVEKFRPHNGQIPQGTYAKYIMVYFCYHESHKKENNHFIMDDICSGPKYELMRHIEDLFFHIHNLKKHQPGITHYADGINEKEYVERSEEGRQLSQAIAEAKAFTKEHPRWFHETYGAPVDVATTEDKRENSTESEQDSGLESFPKEDLAILMNQHAKLMNEQLQSNSNGQFQYSTPEGPGVDNMASCYHSNSPPFFPVSHPFNISPNSPSGESNAEAFSFPAGDECCSMDFVPPAQDLDLQSMSVSEFMRQANKDNPGAFDDVSYSDYKDIEINCDGVSLGGLSV